MAERPILFSGPMVRAILAGQKVQTRRIVKPAPVEMVQFLDRENQPSGEYGWCPHERVITKHIRCPHGMPGDHLWVRETFMENDPPSGWVYRATDGECGCRPCVLGDKRHRWTPAIYMPRRVSRLTLEITGVRVERLQAISEDDARAEGIRSELVCPGGYDPDNFHPPGAYGYVSGLHAFPKGSIYPTAKEAFREGWDAINGKRAPWESNPWVWVIAFRRVEVARG